MNAIRITTMLLFMTTVLGEETIRSSHCDMSKCNKESRILERGTMKNEISIKSTKALIVSWPEEEEIIYTYRRRYTVYCYQGSVLDPNTGCIPSDVEVPVKKAEARESAVEGLCKTGCECSATYCTGQASDCCLDDSRNVLKGPSKYGSTFYEMAGLGRHSCTSRWACEIKIVKVKPTIKGTVRSSRSVVVPDGKTIVFDQKFYVNGVSFTDSVRYYSTSDQVPIPSKRKTEVKCYSSSQDNINCLLHSNGKEVAVPIDPETLEGNLRNMKVKLMEPLETIGPNGTRIKLEPDNDKNGDGRTKTVDISERSASIQSLNEVIDGIKTTQMQEISNSINNRNQIIELENVVTKLISFMSKKYPRLISRIFGGDYSTKWMNEEIFQVCPCTKYPDIPIHSNCNGDLLYIEGEVVKNKDKKRCQSYVEEKITNISLTKINEELDVETIDYLPPKTSSQEDPTWDWLVEMRSNIEDMKTQKVDYNGIKDFVLGMMPGFGFKDFMLYFCFSVSVLWLIEKLITVRRSQMI